MGREIPIKNEGFHGKSYGNMGKFMKHGGLQLGKYGFSWD